jgi:hypothetical protein
LLYTELGDEPQAAHYRQLHARYKPDDNAADLAVQQARRKYPAANHAAEAVVIYPLQRPGAPGLPAEVARDETHSSQAQLSVDSAQSQSN